MAKVVMRHLRQLEDTPLKGACAAPRDGDLHEIHCTVVGPAGTPYAGVKVHFVLELSSEYPVKPPHAYFVTDIAYEGGAVMRDSKGRMQVCLNIFGNFAFVHTEWADAKHEGWSSGYSLETILVQMQSVMHDSFLSTNPADVARARRSASEVRCSCGHTDTRPFPPIPDRAGSGAKGAAAADVPMCYATRAAITGDGGGGGDGPVLGVGVGVARRQASTPAEILSLEAFDGGVRRSSDNSRGFEHFLPLSFCAAHHARPETAAALRAGVAKVAAAMGRDARESPAAALLAVCAALMTGMVVEVMKMDGAGAGTSDRFIDTYYLLLHTLRTVDAECGGDVAREARERVVGPFLAGKTSKMHTPNLGMLLAALPLSGYRWEDVAAPLCAENDARNVFWAVEGNGGQRGPHPELADAGYGGDAERCGKMFACTAVSRKLVCFQRVFSDVAEGVDAGAAEARYGRVDDAAKARIKRAHADVAAMQDWDAHCAYLGLGGGGHAERLRAAVRRSKELGYHGGSSKGGKKGGGKKGGGKGGKRW